MNTSRLVLRIPETAGAAAFLAFRGDPGVLCFDNLPCNPG